MAYINFARMERVLARANELATAPNAKQAVAQVYADKLRDTASAFAAATTALKRAEEARRKEAGEALNAVLALEPQYNSARAVAAAYLPNLELPDTLRALPTDTDQVHAIEGLHDEIEAHHAEPWAAALLAEPFGTLAPQTVRELHEAESANAALAKARTDRVNAYNAAYAPYLVFKRVVRDSYGATSHEYHRIHLRSVAKEEASAGAGATPAGGNAPTSPAPAG